MKLSDFVTKYADMPRDPHWDRQEGEQTGREIIRETGKSKHKVYQILNAGITANVVSRRKGKDGRVYFCRVEPSTPKRRSPARSR